MKQTARFYGRHRASAIKHYQPPAKSFLAFNFEFQDNSSNSCAK